MQFIEESILKEGEYRKRMDKLLLSVENQYVKELLECVGRIGGIREDVFVFFEAHPDMEINKTVKEVYMNFLNNGEDINAQWYELVLDIHKEKEGDKLPFFCQGIMFAISKNIAPDIARKGFIESETPHQMRHFLNEYLKSTATGETDGESISYYKKCYMEINEKLINVQNSLALFQLENKELKEEMDRREHKDKEGMSEIYETIKQLQKKNKTLKEEAAFLRKSLLSLETSQKKEEQTTASENEKHNLEEAFMDFEPSEDEWEETAAIPEAEEDIWDEPAIFPEAAGDDNEKAKPDKEYVPPSILNEKKIINIKGSITEKIKRIFIFSDIVTKTRKNKFAKMTVSRQTEMIYKLMVKNRFDREKMDGVVKAMKEGVSKEFIYEMIHKNLSLDDLSNMKSYFSEMQMT